MGPLLTTVTATLCTLVITIGVARGSWAHRFPCAAVTLWAGAAITAPVSALTTLLALLVDPHTWQYANAVASVAQIAIVLLLLAGITRVVRCAWRLNLAARHRRRRHEILMDLFATKRPDLGGAEVIADHRLFAYSVPCVISGRVVLSQGALDVLGERPLQAVLSHERCHLTYTHHLIVQLAVAASEAFPRWTAARALPERMTELIEMAADCYARRHVGQHATLTAITALADMAVPAGGLPAGGRAVELRLKRLREQLDCCEDARSRLMFALSAAMLLAAPAVAYLNQIVDLCLWGASS